MTTKEKAERIFYSMYNVEDIMGNYPMCFDTAKKCAIIAVDELLNDCDASSPFEEKRINYWQEVKEELIKLKQ